MPGSEEFDCPYCGKPIPAEVDVCSNCGADFRYAPDELPGTIQRRIAKRRGAAPCALAAAAAICIAISLINFLLVTSKCFYIETTTQNDYVANALFLLADAGGMGVLAVAFTGLAFWARRKPLAASCCGLIIGAVFQLARFIVIARKWTRESEIQTGSGENFWAIVLLMVLVWAVAISSIGQRQSKGDADPKSAG